VANIGTKNWDFGKTIEAVKVIQRMLQQTLIF